MTDQDQGQGQEPAADAVAGDDPSVAHDELPEPEDGQQPATDPTPDTGQAAVAIRGEGGEEGQEGSPDAVAHDPSGIEPGETQSVPTLRGPGPGDDRDGGQA